MLTNVDIGTCQNLTSRNSDVVKCRGEKLSPEPDKTRHRTAAECGSARRDYMLYHHWYADWYAPE